MQILETHAVSFVSVTQQLNSSTPMGRLTLHVLLSFAQFEREIISERTRDKQSAARRKGKWTGGHPVLGYDTDPSRSRLVVNDGEAEQIREIFGLFLRDGSLEATLAEMQQRGWRMKSWSTRKGQPHAGQPFDRAALVRLLSNVLYCGEVRHKGKIYAGEQAAILDRAVWRQAQDLLRRRPRGHGARKRPEALLPDLLRCGVCGGQMVAGYSTKKKRRYGYYVCRKAQQQGAAACPGQSIPAARLEGSLLAGLEKLAEAGERQPLREALQGWSGLERAARQRRLAGVVERIEYTGHKGEASVYWRVPLMNAASVSIPIRNRASVPPSQAPESRAAATAGRLPRITRLLALAVRFEGLLRDGAVRDYAELARLGEVSRARITQIMSLRMLAPAIQERILALPRRCAWTPAHGTSGCCGGWRSVGTGGSSCGCGKNWKTGEIDERVDGKMTAIGRRLRRLEAHSGLTETTAEREAGARLLERLEAGRRRLAELRGESVPARVRPPDGHCPGDPKLRPFAVDATVEALYAGRERVRAARAELAG